MAQSESIGKLATALAKVQANIEPALINKKGHHNKYADLNSVFASCRQLLASNGLAVVQMPTAPPVDFGPGVGLTTTLLHESGEWIQETYYLPITGGSNLAQEAGKYITYARRYALAATVGIVADEDNDAQTSGQQVTNGKAPAKSGNLPDPPKPTPAMTKKFHATGTDLYGDEWDDKRPEFVKSISKRRNGGKGPAVTSSKDLYRAEMQHLIDGMDEKLADRKAEEA